MYKWQYKNKDNKLAEIKAALGRIMNAQWTALTKLR